MARGARLEAAWKKFASDFERHFSLLPCKTTIDNLSREGLTGCPNLLLYSAGFPLQLITSYLVTKMYGPHKMEPHIWEKEVLYSESPYHFELDFAIPTQSVNMDKINNFVKEIITHKCIHNDRHIILLHNIDALLRNLGAFQTFRVFLERYTANVVFICTTNKSSRIEKPLLSRFLAIRVPLFDHNDILALLDDVGLSPPGSIPLSAHRNLAYYMFAAVAVDSSSAQEGSALRYPFLRDYFGAPSTMDQLRTLAHRLHGLDVSIPDLVLDLMSLYPPGSSETVLHLGVRMDMLLASTNSNRRLLYIESLLNAVNNTVSF
jgi:hypothetical protein